MIVQIWGKKREKVHYGDLNELVSCLLKVKGMLSWSLPSSMCFGDLTARGIGPVVRRVYIKNWLWLQKIESRDGGLGNESDWPYNIFFVHLKKEGIIYK